MLSDLPKDLRSAASKGSLNPCSNGICSLTTWYCKTRLFCLWVLILVLMEYALWQQQVRRNSRHWHRLNPCSNGICSLTPHLSYPFFHILIVLILVLMEYALWPYDYWNELSTENRSLNPCSNGICSLTHYRGCWIRLTLCLNPCSNGICSLTLSNGKKVAKKVTRLNPCSNGICSLTELFLELFGYAETSLNPCSNGICSLTRITNDCPDRQSLVLILVLMEYALWRNLH